MREETGPIRPEGEIVLYQPEEGSSLIRVLLEGETVWLTQNLLADLFQTTKQNISLHIQNIYDEGELAPEATVKKYLTVRQEGSRTVQRAIDHYNLDMILAVGYRVKSPVATRFRQWATARLHEYLVKGFTLDDKRLKGINCVCGNFSWQRAIGCHPERSESSSAVEGSHGFLSVGSFDSDTRVPRVSAQDDNHYPFCQVVSSLT